MKLDLWALYSIILKSRLFEEAVIQLWNEGKISGEMHLSIGEEAIVAGITDHMQDGDAMALDHRGTTPLLMRGINPVSLLREFLGRPDGLCAGMGGHMHLFSRKHLAASSGIVGASGPSAVGFAMAAERLRPGKIAVAFFGEGAMNQGMLMESMNMAAALKLPVLFVCKDNGWAITTPSSSVTGGNLVDRASSFGINAADLNGSDVEEVWNWADSAIKKARKGKGPAFLRAKCKHPEGHFLGDPLLRIAKHPIKEMKNIAPPLVKSVSKIKGSSVQDRTSSLGTVTHLIGEVTKEYFFSGKDPVELTRKKLKSDKERLEKLEKEISDEIQTIVEKALLS